jgi:hypothetical protein
MTELGRNTPTLIGVRPIIGGSLSKQDFLLFDQLVSPFLTEDSLAHLPAEEQVEIQWLVEQGLIGFTSWDALQESANEEFATVFPVAPQLLISLGFAAGVIYLAGLQDRLDFKRLFSMLTSDFIQMSLSVTAELLTKTHGIRSIPVIEEFKMFDEPPIGLRRQAEVIADAFKALPRRVRYQSISSALASVVPHSERLPKFRPVIAAEKLLHEYMLSSQNPLSTTPAVSVVLESLPVPDDSVPWEQIVDFRSDEQTRFHVLALRQWMRKVSTELNDRSLIREELEYLKAAYSEHLRFHKMKTRTSVWEVILTVPAELIEHLVRFKTAAALKTMFKLREQRVALISAERDAPGREVAYVLKAQERFG